MGRISPEHRVQAELIERVRLELCVDFPEIKGPNFKETGALRLFAVPNGGIRHIQEAVRLKAEGVQRGVPDLVLPVPRGNHCGAYLELKANKGRLSEEQKDWLRFLETQGYAVKVSWTAQDALQFLRDYLSQGNRARRPPQVPIKAPKTERKKHMFRKDAEVMAILSKMEIKAKKRGTVQALVLKVESPGEFQTFLETYEEQCRNAGTIMNLFQGPGVAWKSLQFEAAYVVGVTLAVGSRVIFFRANLVGIKATRAGKNGAAMFTYQIQLEKEPDPETDKELAHFVNVREMNPRTLKMETVKWPFRFEALEPLAQSVDTETGGAEGNEGDSES